MLDFGGIHSPSIRPRISESSVGRSDEPSPYQRVCRGPPGTRTPNLRIKSPARTCRSRSWTGSEQPVCVCGVPIVSHHFPFRHGNETGIEAGHVLSFRTHGDGIDFIGLVLRPEIAALSMAGSSLLVAVSACC